MNTNQNMLGAFTITAALLLAQLAGAAEQSAKHPPGPIQTGQGHHFACADYSGKKVFIVNTQGKVEWEYATGSCNDLWVLPNGNTVISNWLGHDQFGNGPHLIELTPDKKIVWTFSDHQTMKTISSVQILDFLGDVIKGEVLH